MSKKFNPKPYKIFTVILNYFLAQNQAQNHWFRRKGLRPKLLEIWLSLMPCFALDFGLTKAPFDLVKFSHLLWQFSHKSQNSFMITRHLHTKNKEIKITTFPFRLFPRATHVHHCPATSHPNSTTFLPTANSSHHTVLPPLLPLHLYSCQLLPAHF